MTLKDQHRMILRCGFIFVLLWAIATLAVSYAWAERYEDPLMCKPAPEFCKILDQRCRLALFGLEPTKKSTFTGIEDLVLSGERNPWSCDEWVGLFCYIDKACPTRKM